tara:strand:- start:104560 stop:105429 length:870 start_codon:yes stop_codon:yes gene_type:complete
MAQTLETLTRKSDTLTSIRGIVHTMKTLSAINATPYERAASAIEAYHQTIIDGFAAFVYRTGEVRLPVHNGAERVVVVFGSDHGLCGNYNEGLAQLVIDYCQSQVKQKQRVFCIGQRMSDALVELGLVPESVLLPPASADGIGRLAGDIVAQLDAITRGQQLNHIDVTLAYTMRGPRSEREPVIRQLLPLEEKLLQPEKRWESRSLPNYSMAPDALLSALIRSYIFVSMFRASAEAMVTENAARLGLMQQAEKSVDDRAEEVKGEMRSVRQTEITNELMDVITGFEALK